MCSAFHARYYRKLEPVEELLLDAKQVVNCIGRNIVPGALYDEECARLKIKGRLESEAATRFATHSRMLASVMTGKEALAHTVVRSEWPKTEVAKKAKATVQQEDFWTDAQIYQGG